MKLLVVNPNISDDVTELIRAEAARAAAPDTHLEVVTAPYGFEYIETRFEALVAAAAVAEVVAEHAGQVDGVVVAAFGDPGLPGLKELVPVPVVGITEAALSLAAVAGQRFSIVAISDRIVPWYRDCVERCGFAGHLASIRSLRGELGRIGAVGADFRGALVDLAREAARVDGAEVVILAGAPLAGLAREVADQIDVPLVDGVSAGIRTAETLVALTAAGTGRRGPAAVSPPPVKPRRGLSPALEAALASAQSQAQARAAGRADGAGHG